MKKKEYDNKYNTDVNDIYIYIKYNTYMYTHCRIC